MILRRIITLVATACGVMPLLVIAAACGGDANDTPLPAPTAHPVASATPTPPPTPLQTNDAAQRAGETSPPGNAAPAPPPTPETIVTATPMDDGETLTFETLTAPPLDIFSIAHAVRPDADLSPHPLPERDAIGDVREFTAFDLGGGKRMTIRARLCAVTDHADFYAQESLDIPCSVFVEAAARYEERICPLVMSRLGFDSLIGEEPRITLLHARIRGVLGYFDSTDLYPTAVNPHANGRLILYLHAASGAAGDPRNARYDGLVGHELQHALLHLVDPDESTWVSEGLSMLMEHDLANAGSAEYFLESCPPTHVMAWPALNGAAACNYAGAGLIMRYLRERYADDAGALGGFVSEPGNGLDGITAYLNRTGHDINALQFLADWGEANYLAGRSDLSPYSGLTAMAQPTVRLSAEGERSYSFTQFAPTYIDLTLDRGAYEIEFRGDATTPLTAQMDDARGAFWHAGGGDLAAYSLTRSFDLRAVDSNDAVLTLLLRYDTERDWDYAYALGSADDGATWAVLRSAGMTENADFALLGSLLGPGLTGASGEGIYPEWTPVDFDLGEYAGGEVVFRLLYITDQAISLDGVSVGGAWLPGINFAWGFTDVPAQAVSPDTSAVAEGARGGWTPQGFFYSNGLVRQDYAVRLMTVNDAGMAAVTPMEIDADGHGTLLFDNTSGDVRDAALMIMPMAPLTRRPAAGTLTIRSLADAGRE